MKQNTLKSDSYSKTGPNLNLVLLNSILRGPNQRSIFFLNSVENE